MIKENNLGYTNFNTSRKGQFLWENYKMRQKAGRYYRIKNKCQEREKYKMFDGLWPHSQSCWG